jgi:hypothetical protein
MIFCLLLGLLLTACADKKDPAPSLLGRWNGFERTFTSYSDAGQVNYIRHTTYQPDEQYLVFEAGTCEDHYLELGVGYTDRYSYNRRADTLHLHDDSNIINPHQKLAIMEHTPTTLRLLHKYRYGPGMNYVSDITYKR